MADRSDLELMRAALLALLCVAGCGDTVVTEPCMSMGMGGLAAQAALLSVDDYGAGVQCDGDRAEAGAVPLTTHRFVAGMPITLELPPGPHTLVLWAFANTDGTQLLGSACVAKTLPAGGQICLDVTVDPAAPDAGLPPDMTQPPPPPDLAGVPCDVTCGGVCCRNLNGTCATDCTISCAPTYVDCDGDPADGCERAGVKHTDGFGDFFYDCVPLNTFDMTQAMKAELAYDPAGTIDANVNPFHYSDSKGTDDAMCIRSLTRNTCVCFNYQATGNYTGYVGRAYANGKPDTCVLGIVGQPSSYPAWN